MNAFIRLLYALLIAISVAIFIGVGIVSFYESPERPAYPEYTSSDTEKTDEYQAQEKKYRADSKAFDAKEDAYQRNVTYIVLPLAAAILAGGLYLMRKPGVIGEGLALGGILTSAYGAITASMAESDPLRFVAVTLLLLGALAIGHLRFGKGADFGNDHAKHLGKLANK